MRRIKFLLTGIAVLVACFSSCKPQEPEAILANSVTLSKSTLELTEGDQTSLKATVMPNNTTDPSIVWSSNNESVATVAADGVVKALSVGDATITATNKASGKSAKCEVKVVAKVIPVTAVTLDKEALSLIEGDEVILSATVAPENATDKSLKWSSSKEDVVTVSQDGAVKAIAAGTAVVTVSNEASGKSAKCEVTVAEKPIPFTLNLETLYSNKAVFKGNLGVLPSELSSCKISVCYSDSEPFNVESSKKVSATAFDSEQNFEIIISGLKSSTKYQYCALAELGDKKTYGDVMSFTTPAIVASITADVKDIKSDSAVIFGKLTVESEGEFSKGATLYYSSTENTAEGLKSSGIKKTLDLQSDGSYSIELTSLTMDNKYYYFVESSVDDTKQQSEVKEFTTLGYQYVGESVDLGLSVKWATCNLGASSPEGFGLYYAWGETEEKEDFSWSSYKWCDGSKTELTKYCNDPYYGYDGFVDKKTVLEAEDDVATVKLGGSWRMPTDAELTELQNDCTWTCTNNYNGTGVKGYIVTGKKSGYTNKSIFLPAAGYREYENVVGVGTEGYYWSSSLYTRFADSATFLYFTSNSPGSFNTSRCTGALVRPVTE